MAINEQEQIIPDKTGAKKINKLTGISVFILILSVVVVLIKYYLQLISGSFGIIIFFISFPAILLGVVVSLAIIAHNSSPVASTASSVIPGSDKTLKKTYKLEWILTTAVFIFFYWLLNFLAGLTKLSDRITLLIWMLAFFLPLILSLLSKTFNLNNRKVSYYWIIILALIIFIVCFWFLLH